MDEAARIGGDDFSRKSAVARGLMALRRVSLALYLLSFAASHAWAQGASVASTASSAPPPGAVVVLSTNGIVEVLRAGARTWDFASTLPEKNILYPGDQLRTGPSGRATVRLTDRSVAPIGPDGHLQVLPPPEEGTFLQLLKGKFFFLNRDTPSRVRLRTPTATAAIRGTEFVVDVSEANGATALYLIDGVVDLTNDFGALSLATGDAASVPPGKPPTPTPMLEAVNVLQWCLYYPAVLNPDDLNWDQSTRTELAESLQAYRQGDLRGALDRCPAEAPTDSSAKQVYRAALGLSVGKIDEAEKGLARLSTELAESDRARRAVEALRLLIAAVQFKERPAFGLSQSATDYLAESYYHQSRSDLDAARAAAGRAVALAPQFGFAQVRLAELEFGFGRIAEARAALDIGLRQSPRHAQGWALQGFLLAAANRTTEAVDAFNRALDLDPGLANAWLGRGLCRIREGRKDQGLIDLQTAAAAEPQRAVLRSYLGKAFTQVGDDAHAAHELDLARRFDPNDPTSWLYAALLNQRNNHINEAVVDMERSVALNDRRQVYRSRLLLDQDRAVRGANLASIYDDAGLEDFAVREAVGAVYSDYGNFSAHLFLANSYQQLRDPRAVNLRYDTPWLNEYLLANLLAPVGAGTLSQTVSQEEYSRFFERDHFGLVSRTEYLSRGDWAQSAAHYGRQGRLAYTVEETYRNENGQRANGDLEQLVLSAQTKVQITAQDSVFLQAVYSDAEYGDVSQHYAESEVDRGLRVEETQEPVLLAGYHHEWSPGVHTLFFAARVEDHLSITDSNGPVLSLRLDDAGEVSTVNVIPQDLDYNNRFTVYSAELQQIWEQGNHRVIAGGRVQFGDFETRNDIDPGFFFYVLPTTEHYGTDFDRVSAYGYYHWRVADPLVLLAGVSYDRLHFPQNYRVPPVAEGERTEDQVSPKAGLIWSPTEGTTVRAAYTRSLGGVSLDQSYQLEPAQVAGFIQSYRSLIPESAAGPAAVPSHDTWGLALDQKFATGTYLGLSGEWLKSEAARDQGAFVVSEVEIIPGFTDLETTASTTRERLDYEEQTLALSLSQLIGEEWSVGMLYRLSNASLEDRYTDVPDGALTFGGFEREQDVEATLQQVRLFALFNHPSGFFAQVDSVWSSQSNRGYSTPRPGDDFWQFNLHAGYRFARRRAEISVGLLNVTDQNYRLNPLNLTSELPRDRTLAARFRFAF